MVCDSILSVNSFFNIKNVLNIQLPSVKFSLFTQIRSLGVNKVGDRS